MQNKLLTAIPITVIATGLLVVIAWIFDVEILKSVIPDRVTMKFITALSFVAGGSLLFLMLRVKKGSESARLIIPIIAIGIFMTMGTLLVSQIFNFKTGLEGLFINESIGAIESLAPGSPSVASMVNFVLLALIGVISIGSISYFSRQAILMMSGIVLSVGLVAFFGYLVGNHYLYYYIPRFSSGMAIHSALLFILIGLDIIFLFKSAGDAASRMSELSSYPNSKTRKARYLVTIAILFALLGGLGWTTTTTTTTESLYKGKIIIGTETWPGYLPLYVASHKGYFRDAGLDVEVKRYIGLGELSKDYLADKMQGRANLTLDAVYEALQGKDHKIVLAIDYSNGADAIIAKKGIKSVKDLKGKRVGFEPGTLQEFFVGWALQENGMTLNDVIAVSGNPEETTAMLRSGKIDVVVSHEPFLSQIAGSGDFHVVYSSHDAPGLITDILTFNTGFIKEYPETVQAIVTAYFKGFNLWKTNPDEVYRVLANEFGNSPESIANQMKGITMLDEKANKDAFVFAAGFQSLYGNLRDIGAYVQSRKNTDPGRPIDTDILIDYQFIRSIN